MTQATVRTHHSYSNLTVYAKKEPKKHAVMTLVDRDGESRSFHVANVKAKTLREKIVTTVSRKSHLMTDELASYEKVAKNSAIITP